MSTGFKGPIVHGTSSTADGYGYRVGMGMMPTAEFAVFHDDFNSFVVSTAITNGPVANTPWGWAGAIVDTGGTVVINTTAAIGANGVLTFADATAAEGAAIYTVESFQLTAGKKMFIEARIRTDDVTDNNFLFGLSDLSATTNPEDLWTTASANVVSFGLGDGDSNPKMLSDAGNSGTDFQTQTVKGMLVDRWYTLAIYYDGAKLHGYVDGTRVLTWSGAAATIPTGVSLGLFVGHTNGNGAGGNLAVCDYIRVVSER
jgi:hypothetical protein